MAVLGSLADQKVVWRPVELRLCLGRASKSSVQSSSLLGLQSWVCQGLILLVVVWGAWGLFFPGHAQLGPLGSLMSISCKTQMARPALDFFFLQHFYLHWKVREIC